MLCELDSITSATCCSKVGAAVIAVVCTHTHTCKNRAQLLNGTLHHLLHLAKHHEVGTPTWTLVALCYFNPPPSQASVVFTMILADMSPRSTYFSRLY